MYAASCSVLLLVEDVLYVMLGGFPTGHIYCSPSWFQTVDSTEPQGMGVHFTSHEEHKHIKSACFFLVL